LLVRFWQEWVELAEDSQLVGSFFEDLAVALLQQQQLCLFVDVLPHR
jgi:hypothetical protein